MSFFVGKHFLNLVRKSQAVKCIQLSTNIYHPDGQGEKGKETERERERERERKRERMLEKY